jgi:hypothetical protein
MGGWYMREISNYKLQIPNKLQKANYKYLVIEICDLPSKNFKMLTIFLNWPHTSFKGLRIFENKWN